MNIVKGLLAEIRPIPMALLLLTTLLGGVFAVGGALNLYTMSIVLLNAFCFLYVAHLNDTLWDIRKGEYENGRTLHRVRTNETSYLPRWGFGYEIPNAPLLKENQYLKAIIITAVIGVTAMIYASLITSWLYAALSLVGLILAITYSAGLDKLPAVGDTMWEFGVLVAMWCGYYSQKLAIDPFILSISIPLFIALIGVKALDSLPDTIVDDKNNKMTLTVYLYRKGLSLRTIRHIGFIPIYVALIILYLTTPPSIQPAAATAIAVLAAEQIIHRKDEKGRKSIVVIAFIIIAYITYSIITLT